MDCRGTFIIIITVIVGSGCLKDLSIWACLVFVFEHWRTLVPFFLFVLKNIKHIGNTKFREHHLNLKNIKMVFNVFSKTLLSNGFQKLEPNS